MITNDNNNDSDKPNYCSSAQPLEGWGDPNYELRVGMACRISISISIFKTDGSKI